MQKPTYPTFNASPLQPFAVFKDSRHYGIPGDTGTEGVERHLQSNKRKEEPPRLTKTSAPPSKSINPNIETEFQHFVPLGPSPPAVQTPLLVSRVESRGKQTTLFPIIRQRTQERQTNNRMLMECRSGRRGGQSGIKERSIEGRVLTITARDAKRRRPGLALCSDK